LEQVVYPLVHQSPRYVGEVRVIINTTVSRGSAGNLEHHSK
jgi:hypothetical protein